MRALARLRGGSGIVTICAAVGLLIAPPSASAKEGLDLTFRFPAANGYEVTVGGYDATAFISAVKPDRSASGVAWSSYIARGKVSPTAIDADFGDIGSVAMRFHPSGKVTHSKRHRGCLGPDRYTIRFGVFVGSVRFRGEGGYTTAEVHRVKGKEITPRLLACPDVLLEEAQAGGKGGGGKVTRLEANMRSGLTATSFAATRAPGGVGFFVQSDQSIGSLGVVRTAFVHAPPKTLAFDSALSSASVTPPAPFSGTGSFQRGPDGDKDWTGSLAVSFPGAPNVSLAGPEFHPQLTRSW